MRMLNSIMYMAWAMVVIWRVELLKSSRSNDPGSSHFSLVQNCFPFYLEFIRMPILLQTRESKSKISYHWLILEEFCKNDWIHEYNFLTRNAYLYNMPQAIKQMFNFLFNIVVYIGTISLLFLEKKIVISGLNKNDKLYWTGNVE